MKTAKAALVKCLLDGDEVSILTGFRKLLLSNVPREVSRSIINPVTGFNAKVIKTRVDITTSYGHSGYYFKYKLDFSERNKEAIERMKEYLKTKNGI